MGLHAETFAAPFGQMCSLALNFLTFAPMNALNPNWDNNQHHASIGSE